MLISLWKLKQLYLGNGCLDRKNNDIFDLKGIKDSLGNSDHIRHGGVKFHTEMNFGLVLQKWSMGTQDRVVLQSFRPIGYSVK